MAFDYDLFIIGAGPGGVAAARQAKAYGVRVGIAEREAVGGTCVNRGCIPKKFIVYAADFALHDRAAASYGWSKCDRQFDWSYFIASVHQQIEQRRQSFLNKFQQAGIDVIRGQATFIDPHTVKIDGRKVTADKIIVAVGGKSIKPSKILGIEYAITSRQMFELPQLPQRLAIVGGGYIGVEFSSMMNAFGVEVILMDRDETILSGFDDDVRTAVQQGLSQRGIQFLGNTTAKEIKQDATGLQVVLEGNDPQIVTADTVLFATGRSPNTENLGLENAGVELNEKGAIAVDAYSRTNQAHIFAVGDCTNRKQLTPVARTEGRAVARTIFDQQSPQIDYTLVPTAVVARPEAAAVGLTEAQAREKFGDAMQCYRTQFEPLFYSMTDRSEQAMMKLVVDRRSDRVLGAHMVGENAAEIIQSLAVAIQKGIAKQDIDANLGIHPTTGEEFFLLD
ncbi:glutathione-disulfide reductase [Chroococcidiopsis sp. FACHB-1243]|uniref:glutathione-disulfide reductase n=1 Tax=Chroococcidiopsis sp. [FACHB-1243] TaxID=2692781 RepID=UPI00177B969D|nr:glutathione-disulfide reductase [Chroococcidiopsis sp. [FACHB-1243]]MBD2304718.1 glutathione-disulfide reductase [Chroococcidiopsis sp. [FACHB-1243]]